MTTLEGGKKLVELCRQGQHHGFARFTARWFTARSWRAVVRADLPPGSRVPPLAR
jgi:hypothetical protein